MGFCLPFILVGEGKPNSILWGQNPQVDSLRKNSDDIPREQEISPHEFIAHFPGGEGEIWVEEGGEDRRRAG